MRHKAPARQVRGGLGMARANAADNFARARFSARSSFRNATASTLLLHCEPIVRHAVLGMSGLFLAALGALSVTLASRNYDVAVGSAIAEIELIASLAASELDHATWKGDLRTLTGHLPEGALAHGRQILISDREGRIVGSNLPSATARTVAEHMEGTARGSGEAPAKNNRVFLADGTEALATQHTLAEPLGSVVVIHPLDEALAEWHFATWRWALLVLSTGFVLLAIAAAYIWQTGRARRAEKTCDRIRGRMDWALSRGRCGLWDWDLARGRVFWSQSMFDLLGLPARNDLLSFGELNALVHPDDIDLYGLARQLADSEVQSIDHAFRMRHADGHWLWLRVRCELARQEGETGPHLIGIAVDVSEQKHLVERTTAADLRLRDAIAPIPEP